MNNFSIKTIKIYLLFLAAALIYVSCSEKPGGSLYDSDYEIGETPVISNVTFEGKGLAGVTVFTITGENFSPVAEENHVYFGPAKGTILEASATQLVVKAPYHVGDDLDLKVDVLGAQLFSDARIVDLHEPVMEVYGFTPSEKPYAFDLDAAGNVYLSFTASGAGQGLNLLSADSGSIENIGPKRNETFYYGMKFNSANNTVYGVWGGRAVFSSTIGNGTTDVFAAIAGNEHRFFDIDIDPDLNLWVAGAGGDICSILPDASYHEFPFEPEVSSIRVFNNYLYVSAEAEDSTQSVWRFAMVDVDSLGAAELYFDFSSYYESNITAITFSADGDLFIGTDGDQPIIRVTPGGMHEAWYEGVVTGPVMNFAWDAGEFLYYSREESTILNQTILKVDMELSGAPNYGRD